MILKLLTCFLLRRIEVPLLDILVTNIAISRIWNKITTDPEAYAIVIIFHHP